jgi:colicin import membrane protein
MTVNAHGVAIAQEGLNQDQLVKKLILYSILIHAGMLFLQNFTEDWAPPNFPEEFAIEADLVGDIDLPTPSKTVIPDAKLDEKAAAARQMLPQITKKFNIDKAEQEQENIDGENVSEAEKDDVALQKQDKTISLKDKNNTDNRIKMKEALKRLALERLKKRNVAKETKTESKQGLAKIRDQLAKSASLKLGGGGGSSFNGAIQRYRSKLQTAIRRHYSLPKAYNFTNADVMVVIMIIVNDRGDLMKSNVYKSSGDQVFDELAMNAIKSAVPLPKPPRGQAGESIHLVFTPRTM